MAAAADGDFPSSILSEDYQVAARRTIGGTAALSETTSALMHSGNNAGPTTALRYAEIPAPPRLEAPAR
jgi:hypothetical protein